VSVAVAVAASKGAAARFTSGTRGWAIVAIVEDRRREFIVVLQVVVVSASGIERARTSLFLYKRVDKCMGVEVDMASR
jgi:hypothetical protein